MGSDNDAVSSKPTTVGKDMFDNSLSSLTCTCIVHKCGTKTCKACDHVIEGGNFISNVTNKSYNVAGVMSYSTKHVIYLKDVV